MIKQEEIFGPVLPVIPYSNLSTLADDLNKKPSPLVTYFFSGSKKKVSYIEQQIKSGSISVNQVIQQAASPRLPFGGVGESGFGRYHGEESFKTFTYQKVNFTQKHLMNVSLKYPPYNKDHLKWIKKLRKRLF